MATSSRWITITILLAAVMAGCQTGGARLSSQIPAPSFDGPKIAPNAPTAPAPPSAPLAAVPNVPQSWIPRTSPRPWQWIVIHHSASPTGSMAVFDREHRAKGWDGVGYHFVIGNGSGSGDGQVEVTPRWPIQKWGAHAKTPDNRYNDYGIGICLVGNFDLTRPTARQLQSLTELVAYLMQTYHIPPQDIIGHRDTKQTDCPGRFMDVAAVRRQAVRVLVDRGYSPHSAQLAGGELLGSVARARRP